MHPIKKGNCFWGKIECKFEHCKEITAYNLQKKDEHAALIRENKKCGGYHAELFFIELVQELTVDDTKNLSTMIMAFIKKGSKVLNGQIKAEKEANNARSKN
jgi:hypothetical protein